MGKVSNEKDESAQNQADCSYSMIQMETLSKGAETYDLPIRF